MDSRLDKDSELMLDALRGIAALIVLFTHGFDLAVAQAFGWDPLTNPAEWRWARAIFGNGDWCVWCFFVISGICIHRSIARGVQTGSFRWGRYALARITRLYPLFLLGLLLAVAAWRQGLDFGASEVKAAPWRELGASLLNLQIFTTAFPAFSPSWSLSCEVLYYVAWPLLLMLAGGKTGRATLFASAATLGTLAMILVLWRVSSKAQSSTAVEGLWVVTALFPLWFIGAWMSGRWESLTASITRGRWMLGIVLFAASAIVSIVLKHQHCHGAWYNLAALSSLPGLVLMLGGARHLGLSRKKVEPLCRWLSQFSYPCYILHVPLLLLANRAAGLLMPKITAEHPFLRVSLSLGVVLALLAAFGPALERFFMAWRSRVLSGETRA